MHVKIFHPTGSISRSAMIQRFTFAGAVTLMSCGSISGEGGEKGATPNTASESVPSVIESTSPEPSVVTSQLPVELQPPPSSVSEPPQSEPRPPSDVGVSAGIIAALDRALGDPTAFRDSKGGFAGPFLMPQSEPTWSAVTIVGGDESGLLWHFDSSVDVNASSRSVLIDTFVGPDRTPFAKHDGDLEFDVGDQRTLVLSGVAENCVDPIVTVPGSGPDGGSETNASVLWRGRLFGITARPAIGCDDLEIREFAEMLVGLTGCVMTQKEVLCTQPEKRPETIAAVSAALSFKPPVPTS